MIFWTKEFPKKTGAYWNRTSRPEEACVIYVSASKLEDLKAYEKRLQKESKEIREEWSSEPIPLPLEKEDLKDLFNRLKEVFRNEERKS